MKREGREKVIKVDPVSDDCPCIQFILVSRGEPTTFGLWKMKLQMWKYLRDSIHPHSSHTLEICNVWRKKTMYATPLNVMPKHIFFSLDCYWGTHPEKVRSADVNRFFCFVLKEIAEGFVWHMFRVTSWPSVTLIHHCLHSGMMDVGRVWRVMVSGKAKVVRQDANTDICVWKRGCSLASADCLEVTTPCRGDWIGLWLTFVFLLSLWHGCMAEDLSHSNSYTHWDTMWFWLGTKNETCWNKLKPNPMKAPKVLNNISYPLGGMKFLSIIITLWS